MAKILLVEDDKVLSKALEMELEKHSYEVILAFNGEEALVKLDENPDLILLDIIMPKLNGFDTYDKILEDEEHKSTPVIFLTNLDATTDKKRAFNQGAVDYFVKSNTDLDYLIEKIKTHLEE